MTSGQWDRHLDSSNQIFITLTLKTKEHQFTSNNSLNVDGGKCNLIIWLIIEFKKRLIDYLSQLEPPESRKVL